MCDSETIINQYKTIINQCEMTIDQIIDQDAEELKMGIKYPHSMHQMDRRWYFVETFDDLLKLNIEFICGKIYMAPYHCGPICGSQELIKNLVKLHQYGILSVNGQEPICDYNINKGDRWHSKQQRGYLCFCIDGVNNQKLVKSFINQLKNSNLIYIIMNANDKEIISNIDGMICNVTRSNSSADKKKIFLWRNDTSLSGQYNEYFDTWGFITSLKIKEILKKTIYFEVALPEYGKGNLEIILLDMCHNAQTI